MTPDPKDKILAIGRTPSDIELLEALGRGVEVVTDDGVVAMPAPESITLESLRATLLKQRNEAARNLALRAQIDPRLLPPTPPIIGGHHNGRRRNAVCHCNSGRKWKKCCGKPWTGKKIELTAMPSKGGM